MKVPITLPVVHVHVGADDTLSVTVGTQHYADRLTRHDLPRALAEITKRLNSPVRVEVTETDGTTYADIATSQDWPTSDDVPVDAGTQADVPGITGTGFRPGEDVAVTYVITRQAADATGTTQLRLPAVAAGLRDIQILLVGMNSGITATAEDT
ncbi:hypothetical protein KVF89_25605 [Nocardioides carbamazepini]|uniref:hypothetical protein n=1 Tax=Nocardioides carbamazepini TaxID=2854259 RepID=UPI00214A101B|nr:hypothetical protein [Nocardioides carbamazepini]MCR1785937.1 hypothetical protein [Nocardioides carbamazepini]